MISIEATDMKTVLISQRMAAGTVGPVMIYLPKVMSNRGAERLLNRRWKLPRSHSVGIHTGVVELISRPVLNAPVMIQYRGKANRKARMPTQMKEITR